MEKIKLLFITKERSDQLERSSFYLAQELIKQTQLFVWKADGNIHDILSKIPFRPDFILLNDFHPDYLPKITGLNSVPIPKGMFMHDLHYKKFHRKRFIESENIQLVFTHYRNAFLKWYPELTSKMVWFPHFIHPEIFKDYGQCKTINYLMMGANYPNIYPLRNHFIHQLKKEPGFIYHHHPGYRAVKSNEKGIYAGNRYAMEINKAKIFLTCDSIYKYPLLKYFEVLACNTLLIASPSQELTELGFIDGTTFIAADQSNVLFKARHYLIYEEERKRIARNGFQMVMKRHTTEVRVKELLLKIREFIT